MLAKSWGEMGNDRIRYLVFSKRRWRWQPTNAMREHCFKTIKLSKGGPDYDANGYSHGHSVTLYGLWLARCD
jgi:hypothetical protein